MDRKCPSDYVETTNSSIDTTKSFIGHFTHLTPSPKFSNLPPLVQPILTPRFALSCTPELLSSLGDLAASHDPPLPIQTHISESPAEVKQALELFPDCSTYAGVYEKFGLLKEGTILAHCIHLGDEEKEVIKRSGAGVSHCPSSNLHLNSGMARIREMLDMGMKVGLVFPPAFRLNSLILVPCVSLLSLPVRVPFISFFFHID